MTYLNYIIIYTQNLAKNLPPFLPPFFRQNFGKTQFLCIKQPKPKFTKKKLSTLDIIEHRELLKTGGKWWIRTTEGGADGFTGKIHYFSPGITIKKKPNKNKNLIITLAPISAPKS